jgi:hypothetical protein
VCVEGEGEGGRGWFGYISLREVKIDDKTIAIATYQ